VLTIIDRFIIKLYLTYFIAGLGVFVTIFLAVDFMASFVRYDVAPQILLKYYGYFIPSIIYQMIPVGCLVGTVFTLSTLHKTNELVALFSLGTSLARVSAPILVLVAMISMISFWMSDRVLPKFAQKKNYILYVDIKKRPGLYSTVKTGKIWYRSENVLFNIQSLIADESRAQGLTLYYFDADWRLIQLIKAKDVFMSGENWKLSNGQVTLFPRESSFPLTKSFEKKIITMSEDVADLQSSSQSTDMLTLFELNKFIKKNKEAGLETLRYEVDYHGKFGFAFAAFVMSLMGIPFSMGKTRSSGNFMSIGLCVGLALVYWILYSASITLGKTGNLPPMIAAWGPNVAMVLISIFFLIRLKK